MNEESPYGWSDGAIRFQIRIRGSYEAAIEFLRASDVVRLKAAYAERGFQVFPPTGEPLGRAD